MGTAFEGKNQNQGFPHPAEAATVGAAGQCLKSHPSFNAPDRRAVAPNDSLADRQPGVLEVLEFGGLLVKDQKLSIALKAASAVITMALIVTSTYAVAQQEKVLRSFNNNKRDGMSPQASLIFDAAGKLYGTTIGGGAHDGGTVFELTPAAGGGWTETVLHNFHNNNASDGSNPAFSSLILDSAGNLYGTASYGGGASPGGGTVFTMRPTGGGTWAYKVLHTFGTGTDGSNPGAGLIFDATGNLYGTTWQGGASGSGTVFEIKP